jgi:hypothetical protein
MNISSISNQISVPVESATPQPLTADQRALIQAVRAVNAAELFGDDNELTFVLDRQSQQVLARVVDRYTGAVVLEIPPEYVFRLTEEITGG